VVSSDYGRTRLRAHATVELAFANRKNPIKAKYQPKAIYNLLWWAMRTKPPTSKFASSKYRPI